MIYNDKRIAKTIALETLAQQGIDDLDIEVTAIEDSIFCDDAIIRYTVDLPSYGKSTGVLFIPLATYLHRCWELSRAPETVAA